MQKRTLAAAAVTILTIAIFFVGYYISIYLNPRVATVANMTFPHLELCRTLNVANNVAKANSTLLNLAMKSLPEGSQIGGSSMTKETMLTLVATVSKENKRTHNIYCRKVTGEAIAKYTKLMRFRQRLR